MLEKSSIGGRGKSRGGGETAAPVARKHDGFATAFWRGLLVEFCDLPPEDGGAPVELGGH